MANQSNQQQKGTNQENEQTLDQGRLATGKQQQKKQNQSQNQNQNQRRNPNDLHIVKDGSPNKNQQDDDTEEENDTVNEADPVEGSDDENQSQAV